MIIGALIVGNSKVMQDIWDLEICWGLSKYKEVKINFERPQVVTRD